MRRRTSCRTAALTLAGVLALAAPSRADSQQLAAARAAIEDVRYDAAQELLAEALRGGGLARPEVLEIYRLAASTAVVLGQGELAEQFYRRLLALDPQAALDADVAPKFKQPFAAAAAYINGHGAVRARARRLPGGEVEVVVESDPLTMVDAVRAAAGSAPVRLDADRRARLPAPAGGGTVGELSLLDDRGNQLLVLADPAATLPPVTATTAAPSLARTWWVWAIPSGVALAVGIGAGVAADSAASDLQAGLEDGTLYYPDAKDLRSKISSRDTLANVAFATAGVCAVVAGVMWFTRPPSSKERARRTVLAPLLPLGEGGVGLVISGAL